MKNSNSFILLVVKVWFIVFAFWYFGFDFNTIGLHRLFKVEEKANIILDTLDNEMATAYIMRFTKLAIDEEKKYGIPPAFLLAQGLHSTHYGTNELMGINNHFAVTCDSTGSCQGDYKVFETPWRSWRDNSLRITSKTTTFTPEYPYGLDGVFPVGYLDTLEQIIIYYGLKNI